MTSEAGKNDILSTQEAGRSGATKPKLPTSLKVAVGFVIAYGILIVIDTLGSEATAYWIGYGTGTLILSAIIVFLLIKVKKYGWGVSFFLICGKTFEHISTCRKASQVVTDPELLGAIISGNVFFIILLLGALVSLILPGSRKVFKQLHKSSKE